MQYEKKKQDFRFFKYDNIAKPMITRTITFEYIVNDEELVKQLKDSGHKIYNVQGGEDNIKRYVKQVEEVSLEYRTKEINKIFEQVIADGDTYYDSVNKLWDLKYCHKSQSDELEDICSKSLEALADYFLSGFEGEDILDSKRWEKIRRYEVASLVEDYDDSEYESSGNGGYEKRKMTEHAKKQFEHDNKGQISRWNNSTTKKLGEIVSYDNYYEEEVYILDKKHVIHPRVRVVKNRIIDKDIPYMAEWCTVDVDGNFSFDGIEWQVLDSQYDCNPLADSGIVQDKILCFVQNEEYYFFDMNIDRMKKVEKRK